MIVWCETNDESSALARAIPDAIEVHGSMAPDAKVEALDAFTFGEKRVIVTKSKLAGFGLNWQHATRVVFASISHSYEQHYQAVRRAWRFGQKKPVNAHIVIADTEALETLPNRDFLSGYGEVAKYGLLGDEKFFRWLEENAASLIDGDVELRMEAIKRSCQIKAKIVENDEREYGVRALLNLGHTFCHALEAVTNFSDILLHGEGVSIGCNLAFEVSSRLGLCPQEVPSRVREHYHSINVATDIFQINGFVGNAEQIYDLMAQDKKVVNGVIRFILASDIGKAMVHENIDKALILEVLQQSLER
ncbi:MAG: hypothetical protein EBX03_05735 [Rhodobacteraceae bacterium]|nr:hypothetical protein [Paracoccaceae bacterium]